MQQHFTNQHNANVLFKYKNKVILAQGEQTPSKSDTSYLSLEKSVKGDYNIPVDDYTAPTIDQLREIIHTVENSPTKYVTVGCLGGLGRTGTVLAILYALENKVRGERAIAAARERLNPGFIETVEQELFVSLVTATADYGVIDYPELVAAAYYLWYARDFNKKAATEYPKVVNTLKYHTLRYGKIAALKELDTVLDIVSVKLDELSNTDLVQSKKCLDIMTKLAKVWDKIYTTQGGDATIRNLDATLKIKHLPFIFSCIQPDAMYGSKGWLKIVKALADLDRAKNNDTVMKIINRLVNIQHRTGTVFKKFPFVEKLDRVINLKAKDHSKLLDFLPRKLGWLRAKYQK